MTVNRKKKLSNRERKQQAKAEREEKKHDNRQRKEEKNIAESVDQALIKDFGTIAI